MTTPATHTFQAVWPILEGPGHAPLTDAELIEDALADLPDVAARHGVRITGKARAAITDGARFPGLHTAAHVVVAEALAKPVERAIAA